MNPLHVEGNRHAPLGPWPGLRPSLAVLNASRARTRAGLYIGLYVLVLVSVMAIGILFPSWFGSLGFYFVTVFLLGVIYAAFYLTNRQRSARP